ncbi:MAG: sulfotransferase [Novosphingobium sp.]
MTEAFAIADTAEELLADARRTSGIDIIDDDALEPLEQLVASYNGDARLHAEGARQMRKWVIRLLVNRLRMLRDFAAHPEIRDIPLLPPVIIACVPRTGSTKLQKVLAATGDFNNTPFWMTFNPSSQTGIPNEVLDERIADTEDFIDWLNAASPIAAAGHSFETWEPDEDAMIMGCSLRSPFLSAFAHCPTYLQWYIRQDKALQYRYVRDTLKYFIWQGLADASKPFLLKTAYNSGLEEAYLSAFPDAHILISHRDPRKSVPSAARLLADAYRSAFTDHRADISFLPAAQGKFKRKEMAYRDAHPEQRFFDVGYRQITREAEATVKEIYAFCDMPLSDAALAGVQRWETENPQNKRGAYEYAAEDYGFTEQQIEESFADYMAAYARYL